MNLANLAKQDSIGGIKVWALSALMAGLLIAIHDVIIERFKDEIPFTALELMLYLIIMQGFMAVVFLIYCMFVCGKNNPFYIDVYSAMKKITPKYFLFGLVIAFTGMLILFFIRKSQILTPNMGLTNALITINILFLVFLSYFINNKKIDAQKILGVFVTFIGIGMIAINKS